MNVAELQAKAMPLNKDAAVFAKTEDGDYFQVDSVEVGAKGQLVLVEGEGVDDVEEAGLVEPEPEPEDEDE